MYFTVPKHGWLLKPAAPKCLGKQLPHVLGTSLQGYLFSAVQSGAPEHTTMEGKRARTREGGIRIEGRKEGGREGGREK